MTDIEENTWQEGVCKHCGIRLRGEQRMLRLSGGSPGALYRRSAAVDPLNRGCESERDRASPRI